MNSLNDCIKEYKNQIERGHINRAYKGILDFIMNLRTNLKNKYPDYFISSIYQGYMDMTYFSFTPQRFREKKLKIAIIFIHKQICFEIWLAANNRGVQFEYRKLINKKKWEKYKTSDITLNPDSIIEYTLVENPDFNHLNILEEKIESKSLEFIKDLRSYLSL